MKAPLPAVRAGKGAFTANESSVDGCRPDAMKGTFLPRDARKVPFSAKRQRRMNGGTSTSSSDGSSWTGIARPGRLPWVALEPIGE